MTRRKKNDERTNNDNMIDDNQTRQRISSESSTKDDNLSLSRENNNIDKQTTISIENIKTNDETNVISEIDGTATNSSNSKRILNSTNSIATVVGEIQNPDPPIRKSHRISKLRKTNIVSTTITSGTPLSPPIGNNVIFKHPQLNTSSSSSSIVNASTSIISQQTSSNNPSQSCASTLNPPSTIQTKPSRKILVWRENDTRWFFEALCEYGKDFHHIQAYIAAKYEKKGISPDLIKNYENVRHYYYRMWHKVSQMLKIPHEIEKGVLETYGLINYGELWKRVGSKLDVKLIGNLQQLVLYGFTAFKVKGKMFRVRTPVCNALKKLHNIQTPKPSYQIPKEIIVEIVPETNRDWIHVQKLSQNPRLRTKLTLQHRLSTLIEYLEKRWSKEIVLESMMKHLFNDSTEELQQIDQTFSLRLKPKNADKICTDVYLKPTGSIVSNLKSLPSQNNNLDLSLSSFINKQKLKNQSKVDDDKGSNRFSNKTTSKSDTFDDKKDKDKDKNEDKNCDKDKRIFDDAKDQPKSPEIEQKDEQETPRIRMFEMLEELNEKCNEENSETIEDEDVIIEEGQLFDLESNDLFEAVSLLDSNENMTLVQWLNCNDGTEENIEEEEKEEKEEPSKILPESGNISGNNVKISTGRKRTTSSSEQDVELCNVEAAKKGWNKNDADSISIGEIFLLVGCPEKIQLEYSWIENNKQSCDNPIVNEQEYDLDEEIFDRLAFCANALLQNFKKPSSNMNLDIKNSSIHKEKINNNKNIKESKKKISKRSLIKNTKNGDSNDKNGSTTADVDNDDDGKKKNTKTSKVSLQVSSGYKNSSDRIITNSVSRPQPVPEEKVKEALADLYSNSQNIFRRNVPGLKSPLKASLTPKKNKPVEFVVSLGPSFVQNLGQGTFQIEQNNTSACKSPNPIIPIKFIPAKNVQLPSQTEQQPETQYEPFSCHNMIGHSSNSVIIPQQQQESLNPSSTNEFVASFLERQQQQTHTITNFLPSKQQNLQQSSSSSSNSAWLNELHNESSMGSLLAACDLMSQEFQTIHHNNKPRDIPLTDNSVELISQFADFATQQYNKN